MKGIIIAGGYIDKNENIKKYIDSDTFVVCADCGYVYAKEHNISADVLVGDFDSMDKPQKGGFEIVTHPVEKDATDSQLCIDVICEKNITECLLFGALGGKRFDHAVANLQLLEYALNKGVKLKIIDYLTEVFLLDGGKAEIEGEIGDTVSVFALDCAEGLSYEGLKYELTGGRLTRDNPYCVSNSMVCKKAKISLKKGKIIIIHIGGEML